MKVKFMATDSNGGHCPTLFETDRGTVLVQGKIVTDKEAIATVNATYAGLGADETVVEIPRKLLRHTRWYRRLGRAVFGQRVPQS